MFISTGPFVHHRIIIHFTVIKISSYSSRDLYLEKKSPVEIEFGHISETPKGWEERYERQNHDHKVNRHQGKV